jgi:hypothetical protein
MRAKGNGSRPGRRRAAALIEFAVVAPLLLTLLFGIIEYGYVFMIRQTVVHAAREGCRIAVLQTTTEPYTEVTGRVAEIMSGTGITNYTVTMTHAVPGGSPMETVEVSIPADEVSLVGFMFPHGDRVVGGWWLLREGGAVFSTPTS